MYIYIDLLQKRFSHSFIIKSIESLLLYIRLYELFILFVHVHTTHYTCIEICQLK